MLCLGTHFRELARHRDLLFTLGARSIKVRYKQSYLGVAWAILQPLATMVVFTVVFGRWAEIPSDGVPYALFSLSGLLPWTLFQSTVGAGSGALVSNAALLRKASFPREILLLSAVIAALFDTLLAFVIFICISIAAGYPPGLPFLLAVPVLLVAALFGFALTLFLAPANVHYRDVRHAVPLLLSLWMFASPVAYPLSMVPERWRALYCLNPMVGVVEGFRDVTVHGSLPDAGLLGLATLTSIVLCGLGYLMFKKSEGTLADIV